MGGVSSFFLKGSRRETIGYKMIDSSTSVVKKQIERTSSGISTRKKQKKKTVMKGGSHKKELRALDEEVEKLESIITEKEVLLNQLTEAVHKKRERIEKHKAVNMNVSGTWVADMNRKRLEKKLDVVRCKVAAYMRQCNSLLAHDEKVRQDIDDLRREKEIYEHAFRRVRKELQRVESEEIEQKRIASAARSQTKKAIQSAVSCRKAFDELSAKIQLNIATYDREIDAENNSDDEIDEISVKNADIDDRDSLRELDVASARSRSGLSVLDTSFHVGGHNDSPMEAGEYYQEMWDRIRNRTNVDSVEMLLTEIMQLERDKMSKMMVANGLILQLQQLRTEQKRIGMDGKKRTEDVEKNAIQHEHLMQQLKNDASKYESATKESELQTAKYLRCIKMLASNTRKIASIVNDDDLATTVEETLGVQRNALKATKFSQSTKTNDANDVRFLEARRISSTLGEIQGQIALLMQYYTAQIVEGRLRIGGSKQRGLRSLRARGPQHAKGSIEEKISRNKLTIPNEIEQRNTQLEKNRNARRLNSGSRDLSRPSSARPLKRSDLESNAEVWGREIDPPTSQKRSGRTSGRRPKQT